MSKSNWKDMREFLEYLKEQNQAVFIDEEVDPSWEINGITRTVLQEKGPAVVFNHIKGADYPVVTGMLATDKRFLWALGLERWDEFNQEWVKRTEKPIAPRIVESGACQEEIIQEADIDLDKICNIKWHDHDGGAFPGTLSISVTKDPDSGLLNAGIYRMGTLGKNKLGWGAPEYTHGRQHYIKYERMGKPMPMAVITGYDPIIEIAACTRTGPGVDEFHIAGALKGEPVEMVKCKTIDIEVPASSEFVFEGYVYPTERAIEGGFGEYTGYYGEARENPVFVITTVTHRKNPLYLGTREQWYPSESAFCVGKSSQAEAFKTLKTLVPGLLDLRCDVTYEAIAKIDKLFMGHPQQVIDAIWGATYARYKHVIVVDKDIDIWDYDSVHWALSTRVSAERDVYILPRKGGQWLDPATTLKEKGFQTGLGIDATMPTESYKFWDEKTPLTVDDPETALKAAVKWKDRLLNR